MSAHTGAFLFLKRDIIHNTGYESSIEQVVEEVKF